VIGSSVSSDINECLEALCRELVDLKENKFTGNIEMKFNLKEGYVVNINCGLHKVIFIKRKGDDNGFGSQT